MYLKKLYLYEKLFTSHICFIEILITISIKMFIMKILDS